MNEQSFLHFTENLPSRPGFIGNDPLVDYGILVPFVFLGGEYHLLFQKRAESIRQGGEIGFPGGRFDRRKDHDVRDAAIRETVEEMGLPAHGISIEGRMDTFVPGFVSLIHVFIGRLGISSLDELNVNHGEVAEVFTVPVSFFMETEPEVIPLRMTIRPHIEDVDARSRMQKLLTEMGVADRYSRDWEYSSVIRVWRYESRIIWGLTADILSRLVHYMKQK